MSEEHRARQVLYNGLMQIAHRDYSKMVPEWAAALRDDPDFFARVCVHVYNTTKIRDQVDVATITLLQAPHIYPEYREAGRVLLLGSRVYETEPDHIAGIPPFRIFRIWDYIRNSDTKIPRLIQSTMRDYLRALEGNPAWFDAVALRNRNMLRSVYKYTYTKPCSRARALLELDRDGIEAGTPAPYPEDSKLAILKQIANETNPREQARLVIEHKIPYVVAASVLPKMNAAVGVALIDVMSDQEALNSIGWVKRSGLLEIPEVREVFEAKVSKATASVATAEHRKSADTAGDAGLAEAVARAKQKAVDQETHRIEKATLALFDKSSSMGRHFGTMQQIGSRIMSICDGSFMCVLFHDHAQELRVEDNTLAAWQAAFKGHRASGWTSVVSGFELALRRGFMPEQVIIATDGGENRPRGVIGAFADSLARYAEEQQMNPNVIVVGLRSEREVYHAGFAESIRDKGFDIDEFPPPRGEYDYNLFDQIVAVCGGPPAVTLVQRIMETELPRRKRDAKA